LEKLAKRRISRNCILLYRTKICLFHIAAHCFVFYFPSRFFVVIVSQCAYEDAHLFCLYFFSCHVLCLLFCFNAQAAYYILILARKKRTFILPHLPKVCFVFERTSHQIIFYCQSPCITCILVLDKYYLPLLPTCPQGCGHAAATTMPLPPRCRRRRTATATALPPPPYCRRCTSCSNAATVIPATLPPPQMLRCPQAAAVAAAA
jgi:hypothetical protein